ncbi:MAG: ABC transporter substrate binding protein [Pseudolabrys sp.]
MPYFETVRNAGRALRISLDPVVEVRRSDELDNAFTAIAGARPHALVVIADRFLRDFLRLLGGTAAAWPVVARAQQTALPVIGFMGSESPDLYADRLRAFRQGLKETGFVEGQNVAVEFRWAQGQYDRYPEFAAELVRRQVAVIAATGGEPSPQSAKAATQTIPIVFTANGDPVSSGLVASLNRPGGNVTGITIFGDVTVAKRLQLMHELIPQAAIAYLMNPNNPNGDTEMRAAQTAARSFGKEVLVLRASNESELDTAFATMAQQQVGALVVGSDPFFYWRRDQVASLAARHAIPANYYLPGFARAGGLMAYGNSLTDMYRLVGVYVGRILKGEKPGDLPIVQSSKFDLVINLKTAKMLGVTVPYGLLNAADEVIE